MPLGTKQEQSKEHWIRGLLLEEEALLCIYMYFYSCVLRCFDFYENLSGRGEMPFPKLDNFWRHKGPARHTWDTQTDHPEPHLLSGPCTQEATFLCLGHLRARYQAPGDHFCSPKTTGTGQTVNPILRVHPALPHLSLGNSNKGCA